MATESLEAAHLAPSPSPSPAAPPLSYGEQWANAFGICIQRDGVTFDRSRYAFLKDKLVFKMDAVVGNSDPLTAFMEEHQQQQQTAVVGPMQSAVRGSINWDSDDEEDDGDDDDTSDEAPKAQRLSAANGEEERKASVSASPPHSAGWAQYFSDETLLYEINTDLERLYPAGNETLFQNEEYRGILRHVLFVWCKLHPDVSYRQGMHDVAAVVLYAFLVKCGGDADGDAEKADPDLSNPLAKAEEVSKKKDPAYQLPEFAEADTFLVFEAIMLYLKPFYEIAQTLQRGEENGNGNREGDEDTNHATGSSSSSHGEPRLFGNFSLKENDDPSSNALFGDSSMPISTYSSSASGNGKKKKQQQPPLNRICCNIQYELLQQKDPQLYYHLQNLEIVPETYCLRWIRLLLAREFEFDELLQVWDAMIQDRERPDINFPHVSKEEDYLHDLPSLAGCGEDNADSQWIGFPLLRYLCVAKLLTMAKQLRSTDNTGCWRLLMQTAPSEDSSSTAKRRQEDAKELIRFAQVLRNPMLASREGPEGIDVVEFQAGSLGIILTAAKAPFEDRLAVKAFVDDPQARSGLGVGQAQASGKVVVGDILHSINGVPIVGVTTEEVKRHIQLIGRPMHMGFFHAATISSTLEGFVADGEALPSQGGLTPERVGAADTSVHFLPGELCYAHVETSIQSFVLSHDGSCLSHYLSGKLYISNYRCFFTRLLGKGDIDWQIPVLSISSVDGMDNGSSLSGTAMDHAQAVLGFTSDDTYKVVIRCKDTQVVRLSFSNHSEYSKLYKCLSCLAFPVSLLDAFCFAYSPTIAPSEEVPFDIRREYQRIGLLDFPDWLRCIDQSLRYDLCDTYPQHLIVPSAMSDVRIKAAAAFRSHARLPVVSWIHRGNGATISRSSQPLVGLKSARSMDDELLVRLLCVSNSNNDRSYGRYVIMDARGQLAAVGNKAMGKGTEIISNYRGGKLIFMNIDNIHAIRQSFQSLTSIFEPRKGGNEDSSSFYSKIESSGWLRHVRLVLKASSELAHSIHNGVSVLTHCSDGWDRTAQMVSLAEMMLDPHYRTLRGFQCLIEKEWCSFGHQFGSRCGHARSDATNDQRSPVFLMWLDCVWQFIRQFPSECEFNEKFLITLADHLFSCKYGTFMFDCERQRKEIFAKHRVFSIWSELNSNSDLFTNQLFAPSEKIPLLTPSTLSKNINFILSAFDQDASTFSRYSERVRARQIARDLRELGGLEHSICRGDTLAGGRQTRIQMLSQFVLAKLAGSGAAHDARVALQGSLGRAPRLQVADPRSLPTGGHRRRAGRQPAQGDDPRRRHGRADRRRERNGRDELALAIEGLQPYLARYLYMYENKDNSVTIVMKYYSGGSLADRVRDTGSLHQHGILHLDVKAGNTLFDSDSPRASTNLKLVDFGSSTLKRMRWWSRDHSDDDDDSVEDEKERQRKAMGTFGCMAPERFEGKYGPEADVYGAGVVLYHMIVGEIPFPGTDPHQIVIKNMQGDVSFASPKWRRVSNQLRHVTERMLDKDPKMRITIPEILKMRWLFQNLSNHELMYSPSPGTLLTRSGKQPSASAGVRSRGVSGGSYCNCSLDYFSRSIPRSAKYA